MDSSQVISALPNGTVTAAAARHKNEDACYAEVNGECNDSVVISETTAVSLIVKAPRPDSKLILQNMEEVLNSVKRKHRQKHRRKREQKKMALLAEQSLIAKTTDANGHNGESKSQSDKMRPSSKSVHNGSGSSNRKHVKKPLQEQQATLEQNNQTKNKNNSSSNRRKTTISPMKNAMTADLKTNAGSILQHIVRTPKKNEEEYDSEGVLALVDTSATKTAAATATQPKPAATNAFEFMMKARNKSIGSNTPGKEASEINGANAIISSNDTQKISVAKAKRKLLLQSWSDRKGGSKRKLDEEARAAFVDQQLENRAKRFKNMLTSGNSPRGRISNKLSPKADLNRTEPAWKPTTKTIVVEEPTSSRSKLHSRRSRRSRPLSLTDSIDLIAESNSSTVDPETAEFLSKLASPTKKRDNLLGYFSKVPSPKDVASKAAVSHTSTPINNKDNNGTLCRQSEQKEDEKPKRRGRPPRKSLAATVETASPNNAAEDRSTLNNSQNITTASTRPKRICAGKARYDYDLENEESPTKLAKVTDQNTDSEDVVELNPKKEHGNVHRRRKAKSISEKAAVTEANDDVVTIDLEDSGTQSSASATQTPRKLAPLFVRAMPKPSLDFDKLKARREFLHSGVPDILRVEQEKVKQYEQSYEETIELFPKINHLQQWSDTEQAYLSELQQHATTLSFRMATAEDDILPALTATSGRRPKSTKNRNSITGITSCTAKDLRVERKTFKNIVDTQEQRFDAASLPIVDNKRLIIKAWKTEFDRFPTYKCYNQLRAKYRFFSALDSTQDTQQVTESFMVTRSTRRCVPSAIAKRSNNDVSFEEEVKPPETAPNGELLFVEKYKPMLFEQVLVNSMPVAQLRDFLASWANGSNGGSQRNSQNLADDSQDFMNDSNSSQQITCNSVVLLGPASSGKTNAVFTLANEMNFNVLEINAGMKRTGKKLIQELQEATQSHQIRNESPGGAAVNSKAQKNLLKMSLNGLKSKKQTNTASDDVAQTGTPLTAAAATATNDFNARKCLILIEDADIVFEQTDAGFTDAIYTLAASSKRPVIVIANNPHCQHLQRLMNQNTIKFSAPNALSISKYLAVLTLMENCPVNMDDLISLYLYNREDLRKTLHELQFFVQSGGDRQACDNIDLQQQRKQQQLQRTPQKSTKPSGKSINVADTGNNSNNNSGGGNAILDEQDNSAANGKYFASPNKRRFSEDTQSLLGQEHDEQLKREGRQQQSEKSINRDESNLYMHRSLFEFNTVDQNEKRRVPFPVNFDLFYINLSDIFGASKRLNQNYLVDTSAVNNSTSTATTKRKTRSPKKFWLSTATAAASATSVKLPSHGNENTNITLQRLQTLSVFYENISIATSISAIDGAPQQQDQRDCLKPYLSENIAHDLLERSIDINLEANACPYNLFESTKKKSTLCDYMGASMIMQTKRSRSMDFEPALRAICRSETQRAARERRSTRFYHYLRNSCATADICNFSQLPFDNAVCGIFEESLEQDRKDDTMNSR